MATKTKEKPDVIIVRDEHISEDKAQPFHLAAMLMERTITRPKAHRFTPYQVAQDAAWLVKAGNRMAAYALQMCNGPEMNDRQEAAREKLADRIRERAAWYGLTASCSGDPRGYVVRLEGEGVQKNGWGDGFGVA